MKKLLKICSIITFSLSIASCENKTFNSNSENLSSDSHSTIEESSNPISTDENSSSVDDKEYTTFVELEDVFIEVGETYSLKNALSEFKGIMITSQNVNIAFYNSSTSQIMGNMVGSTSLILKYREQFQLLPVTVVKQGTYANNFVFDRFHLEDKNIVAFGDSVTADATLGGSGLTYVSLFANKYHMNLLNNYAIGGTTATYMYEGSNIYKEYANNKTAIDGCRVVYNAFKNEELENVDYAFIAYGHNDQYFQPPVTVSGDDVYCVDNSFSSCHSYKGSYRYMINVLREANPNVRIILLNCTYSEYDIVSPSPYGSTYNYTSYRMATKEIAEEMNCRYIDPWDYMKDYFDYDKTRTYYSDSVHLTAKGHQVLSNYIYNN